MWAEPGSPHVPRGDALRLRNAFFFYLPPLFHLGPLGRVVEIRTLTLVCPYVVATSGSFSFLIFKEVVGVLFYRFLFYF